ncbi:8-amino-7-oxononanoate synthase [Pseudoalteromonas sp. NBT06-2]|uniref:8-amino-7-oxononanoate synthase n=1 Tax=Pseudoalteromonas sp. NBT06-2 TaxID=2025950 RepID=UPI000BA6BDDF|nr:8-amino-7-oxononanoate synthase [Pseudoalteromonas sp. NBT06-2]PAJ73649.1 8-amino-7-oxononanoate synthase [Pseudoalteromonas sp. NBT06-2]
MAFEYLSEQINQRKKQSLFRQRFVIQTSSERFIEIENKQYLNFASNDYLSVNASCTKLDSNTKQGSTSSALVTGFHQEHVDLENYLSKLMGYESCLLFSSGFSANASVLKTLMSNSDTEIFQDKLNHASLIDGGLASKAKMSRFRHNDLEHLTTRLEKSDSRHKLIVTEGVFSMDGDKAPVSKLKSLAHKYNAWLMVDDAHGFGICGNTGLGSCEEIKPELLILTFGKAVASSGACILCCNEVKDYLLQFNREYIFSTAMSPFMAKVTQDAITEVVNANTQRNKLRHNINLFKISFKKNCAQFDVQLLDSGTPIQPIIVKDPQLALDISNQMKQKKIWLTAIRPPTVPKNTARLRITITAAHSESDIACLIDALVRVFENNL